MPPPTLEEVLATLVAEEAAETTYSPNPSQPLYLLSSAGLWDHAAAHLDSLSVEVRAAQIDYKDPTTNMTAVHFCCLYSSPLSLIRSIISTASAPLKQVSMNGKLPLHLAAQNCDLLTVTYLVEKFPNACMYQATCSDKVLRFPFEIAAMNKTKREFEADTLLPSAAPPPRPNHEQIVFLLRFVKIDFLCKLIRAATTTSFHVALQHLGNLSPEEAVSQCYYVHPHTGNTIFHWICGVAHRKEPIIPYTLVAKILKIAKAAADPEVHGEGARPNILSIESSGDTSIPNLPLRPPMTVAVQKAFHDMDITKLLIRHYPPCLKAQLEALARGKTKEYKALLASCSELYKNRPSESAEWKESREWMYKLRRLCLTSLEAKTEKARVSFLMCLKQTKINRENAIKEAFFKNIDMFALINGTEKAGDLAANAAMGKNVHQAMEDAARSPQRRKRARVSRDSSVGGRRRGVFRAQELDAALMAEVYNEWNGGKDIFSIVLSFL